MGDLELADHLGLAVGVLGVAVANPASTARAAFSASRVSDFPFMRRSRRTGRPASATL
jgi:hypothetical protein